MRKPRIGDHIFDLLTDRYGIVKILDGRDIYYKSYDGVYFASDGEYVFSEGTTDEEKLIRDDKQSRLFEEN